MHILCTSVLLAVTYIPYILIEIPPNPRVEKDRSPDDASLLVYHVGSSFDISVPGAELRRLACLPLLPRSVRRRSLSWFCTFICPTSIEDMNYRLELECMYGAASISGTFSGHLVAGMERLDGKGNLAGWRWIFLLEHCLRHLRTLVVTQHSPAGSLV